MKTRYAEIPAPAAPAFERVRSFTRSAAADRRAARPGIAEDYVHTPHAKSRGRELPTLGIVGVLMISALVVAAYISNTVTVDNLMRTITTRDRDVQQLVQQREALRAELNLLTSSTRIQKIATEELGLVHSRMQPFSLEVPGYVPRQAEKRVR